jgi:predicted nuclease of predicted toxin-antitoxin system
MAVCLDVTAGVVFARALPILPKTASDEEIVAAARDSGSSVLTQDLDFSAIVALSDQVPDWADRIGRASRPPSRGR